MTRTSQLRSRATRHAVAFGTRVVLALALGAFATDVQAQGQSAPATRTVADWLAEGWRLKAAADIPGAIRAFEQARAAGADGQLVELEIGYLELQRGHRGAARGHFDAAAGGADPGRAEIARRELRFLPAHLWADVYAEVWAWHRVVGAQSTDLVPTLRVRGFVRPFLDLDLSGYIYAQGTRDVLSQGNGTIALSRVYADNRLLLGAGALLRLWQGRLGIFVQGGPALNLLRDGQPEVQLDVRAGAMLMGQTTGCRPAVGHPVRVAAGGCVEGYSETVWVNRFNNDLIAFFRGRLAYNLFVTGPIAWQPLIESRVMLGLNRDYWNNFAEAGVMHRWRLLEPFVLDLSAGVAAGTYLGLFNAGPNGAPLPSPSTYVEGRLLLTTYLAM